MKTFCVFAAICIIGVYSNPKEDIYHDHPRIVECAKELNIDLPKIDLSLRANNSQPTDDAYRLYVCQRQKRRQTAVSQLINYEDLKQYLEKEDEPKMIIGVAEFRQNLLSNLTECKSKGLSEVEFLKCIKFLDRLYMMIYRKFMNYMYKLSE